MPGFIRREEFHDSMVFIFTAETGDPLSAVDIEYPKRDSVTSGDPGKEIRKRLCEIIILNNEFALRVKSIFWLINRYISFHSSIYFTYFTTFVHKFYLAKCKISYIILTMSIKFFVNFNGSHTCNSPPRSSIEKKLFLKGDNGNSVILVHGLTGTPYEMWYLAKFLNKKGYTVICPRLANHGEPIEILKNTTWQECYQSVKEAFLEITSLKNSGLIFAGGLSVGALLILLLADEFPDKIAAASCLSPTLFYDGWNMPWSRHLLPLVYYTPIKKFLYFKEEAPYGIKNEAIRKRVHECYSSACLEDTKSVDLYGYPYFPLVLLYQHNLLVRYFIKKLSHINLPVQLVQAKDDDMTSVKNSQFIYERIKSETKELILLENSYHVITADQEREKVAQEMERFFTSRI